MKESDERRRLPRVDINWPVTIFAKNETIDGESRNISSEGLYICSDKPLLLNETYQISIKPPHHQAIGVTGKIVWSDLYGIDDKKTYGVGVCLVKIPETDRHLLKEVIAVYI